MSTPEVTVSGASRTVVAQIGARAVSLLAIGASTAIVARTIGVDAYADWGTVLALASLTAVVLDPGLGPVVLRRLAQDRPHAPSPRAMLPVRLALGLGSYAVVVAVCVGLRGTDVLPLALVLGGQVPLRALVLNAQPWLQLDQRLHRQTALEAITSSVGVLLLGVAALADAPVELLAALGFAIPTAVLVLLVSRELRMTPTAQIPAADGPPMRERVGSVLREVAPLAVALLCVGLYTRAFVVFLNSGDFSDDDVATFLLAFQVIEQLIVAAAIVAGAILPLLAVRRSGRELLADPAVVTLVRVMGTLGMLASGVLLATADPAMRLLGGSDLAGAGNDLELLAPMGATILPSIITGYVLLAAGMGRQCLAASSIALAANLAANATLTLEHGPLAAARISWGTEALAAAVMLVFVARAGGWRAPAFAALGLGLSVLTAELVAAGTVAPGIAGAALVAVGLALGGRELLRLARLARG